MPTSHLSVSHTGSSGAWTGLIKRGRQIIWRCPHRHANRDNDAGSTAARPCARRVLEAIQELDKARESITAMERGVPTVMPGQGHLIRAWMQEIARRRWALEVAESLQRELAANHGGIHEDDQR